MKYNLFHEIDENQETNQHLAKIIESISKKGWIGSPLLAIEDRLVNGCHRATACKILGVEPNVHHAQIKCTWGDDEYSDYLLENLANAIDTLSVLQALNDLLDANLIDEESVRIMQEEYDKE